ncbi:MAG: hypothetical protein M1837_004978 [Sclerophora amabilis]|nr:MAG: hypothetical protein M1837_004978 [Sclerophora amabilis]
MTAAEGRSSLFSAGSPASRSSKQSSNLLDLSTLPPTYLLTVRLPISELHEWEDRLVKYGLPLTYAISEAELFLGRVGTKRRAEFELRCRNLWTKEDPAQPGPSDPGGGHDDDSQISPRKRQKTDLSIQKPGIATRPIAIDDSSTESEVESAPDTTLTTNPNSTPVKNRLPSTSDMKNTVSSVKVIKLDWLEDSITSGKLLSLTDYIVYEGHRIPRPPNAVTPKKSPTSNDSVDSYRKPYSTRKSPVLKKGEFRDILQRAKADQESSKKPESSKRYERVAGPWQKGWESRYTTASQSSQIPSRPPRLLQQTTSEHDEDTSVQLPDMPTWVKEKKRYACERATPANPPNEAFIEQLKEIKLARLLNGDEIGVRAYSTSIASLAAYPHTLTSTKEILALPGCDSKIAHLFNEWKTSNGQIQVVSDITSDESHKTLHHFYDIWGVGAKTARAFYYDKGWRDLDDIVEYGWDSLSRVQQIGVKYYEEFLNKIPRAEVESIAAKVAEHARRITNDGTIETCIVGGYRRGKVASGDVDMILSHRDETQTLGLVKELVLSLEEEGCITHTLLLDLTGSKRDQQPLPYRTGGGGHGFDTLDKALVVWQDTDWPSKAADEAAANDGKVKNPNIHRRVDIIVAPWWSVGCAIVGWSGGTTFQRDLRSYARNVHGWKFDSSGIRDRTTGRIVDLEGRGGVAETWMEAERKVFEGLGLEYREPWERCTG